MALLVMDMEKQAQNRTSPNGLLAKAISVRAKGQAIVERDGIFSIRESLETGGVKLDPVLKALVDSVLDSGQSGS